MPDVFNMKSALLNKGEICYFCRSDKSVRYTMQVGNSGLVVSNITVPCCNKCAFTYGVMRKSMVKIHYPDKLHGWGIEYNHGLRYENNDASSFIMLCRKEYECNPTAKKGTLFHQCGHDSNKGYQFFEYWGPDEEEVVREIANKVASILEVEVYDERKA